MIIDLLARCPELTRRERQVCAGVLRGLGVKEIGRELGCSFRTVEDHKTAIYKKLGVRTGLQLVHKVYGEPEIFV